MFFKLRLQTLSFQAYMYCSWISFSWPWSSSSAKKNLTRQWNFASRLIVGSWNRFYSPQNYLNYQSIPLKIFIVFLTSTVHNVFVFNFKECQNYLVIFSSCFFFINNSPVQWIEHLSSRESETETETIYSSRNIQV